MSLEHYEITRILGSGGLIERLQINDGPWFVSLRTLEVEQDNAAAELTRLRAQQTRLAKAARAVVDDFGPFERKILNERIAGMHGAHEYLSPSGAVVSTEFIEALQEALATLDVPEKL